MSDYSVPKPGFVPQGWIKGEPLTHVEPSTGPHGVGMITVKDSSARAGDGPPTTMYYLGAEAVAVAEWLSWWVSAPATNVPEPLQDAA